MTGGYTSCSSCRKSFSAPRISPICESCYNFTHTQIISDNDIIDYLLEGSGVDKEDIIDAIKKTTQ